jgi:hypothetical protein
LIRVIFVAICTFPAVALPFFSELGALLAGAVGIVPLTFVYPLVFWNGSTLAKNAPRWRTIVNCLLIVSFSLVGVGGTVGSLYGIIRNVENYRFFS